MIITLTFKREREKHNKQKKNNKIKSKKEISLITVSRSFLK